MLSLFFTHLKIPRIPRIPTGATWLGLTSLIYGIWINRNRNQQQAELRRQLEEAARQQAETQNKIQSDLEIIRNQNEEILRNQNKSFKDKFFDLFTNKKSKLTDETSVFDNIRDFFNSYTDFFINLTLEQQIVLLNFLCSILLLSYFLSILLIFYGNYLIERFDNPPWRE